MEILNSCPICSSQNFNESFSAIDYTVSRETFTVVECQDCGFMFTNPRPKAADLGRYYRSEEYVSHSNSKKGFINSAYQSVRKYTLLKKLQLILRYKRQGKLLDIGCGTGEFLQTMRSAKWDVQGIEPGDEARNLAQTNYSLNVSPESHLAEIESGSFDVISMWHVLEHVPNLNERIEDLRRLIKADGLIIIAVPNRTSLDAKIYGSNWAAWDLPRHLYHFRPKDIKELCSRHNLKVVRVLPMIFDSFYVSMLTEKNVTGKVHLLRSTWNGLRSNFSAMRKPETSSSQIYLIRKT